MGSGSHLADLAGALSGGLHDGVLLGLQSVRFTLAVFQLLLQPRNVIVVVQDLVRFGLDEQLGLGTAITRTVLRGPGCPTPPQQGKPCCAESARSDAQS